ASAAATGAAPPRPIRRSDHPAAPARPRAGHRAAVARERRRPTGTRTAHRRCASSEPTPSTDPPGRSWPRPPRRRRSQPASACALQPRPGCSHTATTALAGRPSHPTSPSGILHRPVASTDQGYKGLLVDWGGGLTTNLFESFSASCQQKGLAPDTIRRRFREDDACRTLLVEFETGKLEEEDFEPQFARHLGVAPAGLIDRLFAGSSPDEEMVDAVRRFRAAGIR